MKLNVGLIGLGRLGRVYARDLAARVTGVRLAALADTNATLAEETARELDVPRWYADPLAMLDDPGVDAAIIVSPTHTHTELAVAALGRGKADARPAGPSRLGRQPRCNAQPPSRPCLAREVHRRLQPSAASRHERSQLVGGSNRRVRGILRDLCRANQLGLSGALSENTNAVL